MNSPYKVIAKNNGIKLVAYRGIGMVLLAYDIEQHLTDNLAGFAILCTQPDGFRYYLSNRLTFEESTRTELGAVPPNGHDSIFAPFQKLRWLHVPSKLLTGVYHYEVIPLYFRPQNQLQVRGSVSIDIELYNNHPSKLDIGFTRGFLGSQAYAERFKNKPFRPADKTKLMFDPHPYEAQYNWLGGKAYKMLKDFLTEGLGDDQYSLDALVYDCDIPDFVGYLGSFGNRLRIVFDTNGKHGVAGSLERQAAELLTEATVRFGEFGRQQHNKVLILRKNGNPVKVLTGSANFSIRGFFAQANNVLVFDDTTIAKLYDDYFEAVLPLMSANPDVSDTGMQFRSNSLAKQWFPVSQLAMPKLQFSFAPHTNASTSLDLAKQAVHDAKRSVLFAIMGVGSGSLVLDEIFKQKNNPAIFDYGTYDNKNFIGEVNLNILKQHEDDIVPATLLNDKLPEPFLKETESDGATTGITIHHKFVVVDFNSSNPVVFTGSSNLADSGEESNGDNLIAIYDDEIATAYAVEAIRLFDHYSFRFKQQQADEHADELFLAPDNSWVLPYFDSATPKFADRVFFTE